MQILKDIKTTKIGLVDLELEQKNCKMLEKTLTKYYNLSFTIFTKKFFKYNLLATITTSFYLGFNNIKKAHYLKILLTQPQKRC